MTSVSFKSFAIQITLVLTNEVLLYLLGTTYFLLLYLLSKRIRCISNFAIPNNFTNPNKNLLRSKRLFGLARIYSIQNFFFFQSLLVAFNICFTFVQFHILVRISMYLDIITARTCFQFLSFLILIRCVYSSGTYSQH